MTEAQMAWCLAKATEALVSFPDPQYTLTEGLGTRLPKPMFFLFLFFAWEALDFLCRNSHVYMVSFTMPCWYLKPKCTSTEHLQLQCSLRSCLCRPQYSHEQQYLNRSSSTHFVLSCRSSWVVQSWMMGVWGTGRRPGCCRRPLTPTTRWHWIVSLQVSELMVECKE